MTTLLWVAVLHAAMVYILLQAPDAVGPKPRVDVPIQAVLLPPPPLPRVRIDALLAQRLSPARSFTVELPVLSSLAQELPSSAVGGHGPGVDWNAEAHRAVRAFEIRREQSLHSSNPGSTQADDWSLFHGHHAGDRSKTEHGDWIVWINSDCYQVAAWHVGDPETLVNAPPRTVCADDPQAAKEVR